jgi:hypothetical protein
MVVQNIVVLFSAGPCKVKAMGQSQLLTQKVRLATVVAIMRQPGTILNKHINKAITDIAV